METFPCMFLILVLLQSCIGNPALPISPKTNLSLEQRWINFKHDHDKYYADLSEEVSQNAIKYIGIMYN